MPICADVTGILSDEEMATIDVINQKHFAWENRKGPLLDVMLKLDADLMSLVELDFYDDYFKPELAKHGYGAVFKKRPRDSSDDGCGIFYRESVFTLIDSVRSHSLPSVSSSRLVMSAPSRPRYM